VLLVLRSTAQTSAPQISTFLAIRCLPTRLATSVDEAFRGPLSLHQTSAPHYFLARDPFAAVLSVSFFLPSFSILQVSKRQYQVGGRTLSASLKPECKCVRF
jgi:hypothetical protein